MGLDRRKTSGRIFGGANLVVPDQPIYSVKNFPPSFQYKKGTPKDEFREIPPTTTTTTTIPPTTTTTTTIPITETYYILTEAGNPLTTENGIHIIY